MGYRSYVFPTQDCAQVGGWAALPKFYICDAFADLPAVVAAGSKAFVVATGINYTATAANTWTADGGGGITLPINESDVTNLVSDLSTLTSAIFSEASTRAAADSSEASTRASADSSEASTRAADDASEASARAAADALLVPKARVITTTAPLKIAGAGSADLSADRTVTVDDATTSAKGVVQLATPSSDVTAGHVVQANDARLSDARTPTAHATSHKHGGSDEVAVATPAANGIPKADASNKLAAGWISAVLASSDLTNDSALEKTANKAAASGYASLDSGSKVVQDPANATATPTASKIPIADGSGKLDSWITGATAASMADSMLLKPFFSAQSMLPGTTYKENLYTLDAPDFTNIGAGSLTRSMSRGLFSSPSGVSNFGWDVGGLKTKMLFAIHRRSQGTTGHSVGIWIADTQPSTTELANKAYLFYADVPGNAFFIYKRTGGAYTQLATITTISPPPANVYTGHSFGMAIYYDDSTDRLVCFVRMGSECWFPIMDITDTALTTVRYCGIRDNLNSGVVTWSMTPMGIYYTA